MPTTASPWARAGFTGVAFRVACQRETRLAPLQRTSKHSAMPWTMDTFSKRRTPMSKTKGRQEFVCTGCSIILTRSELVTVHNPEWVLRPVDTECCPHCKSLCVEVASDEEVANAQE